MIVLRRKNFAMINPNILSKAGNFLKKSGKAVGYTGLATAAVATPLAAYGASKAIDHASGGFMNED